MPSSSPYIPLKGHSSPLQPFPLLAVVFFWSHLRLPVLFSWWSVSGRRDGDGEAERSLVDPVVGGGSCALAPLRHREEARGGGGGLPCGVCIPPIRSCLRRRQQAEDWVSLPAPEELDQRYVPLLLLLFGAWRHALPVAHVSRWPGSGLQCACGSRRNWIRRVTRVGIILGLISPRNRVLRDSLDCYRLSI